MARNARSISRKTSCGHPHPPTPTDVEDPTQDGCGLRPQDDGRDRRPGAEKHDQKDVSTPHPTPTPHNKTPCRMRRIAATTPAATKNDKDMTKEDDQSEGLV